MGFRQSVQKVIRKEYFVFLVLLIIGLIYGYHKSINRGPYGYHMYRQADCASIASNYYHEDLPFLEPEINWIGKTGTGKTVSEFPVIYYLVGNLWKVFGQHHFIFRGINLLILFLGLFYLYKLLRREIKSIFWSMSVVVFVFTSQLLAYYGNNFIANAPAFGLALIGLYHFRQYYRTRQNLSIYLGCLFFLIASLLKITSLLSLMAIVPVHICFILFTRDNGFKKIHAFLPLVLLACFIALWYRYAAAYNESNLAGIFLQGLLPIWDMNPQDIEVVNDKLTGILLPRFFNIAGLIFVGLAYIFLWVNFKRVNKFMMAVATFCIIGIGGYLILFYQVFDVHDYYLTNLVVVIPLVLLPFFELLNRTKTSLLKNIWIRSFCVGLLLILVYDTAVNTRIKFHSVDQDWLVKHQFTVDEHTESFCGWFHWDYSVRFEPLQTIEPKLREIGIKRNDLVISIPDHTINASLYLMNQRGFSDFGYNHLNGAVRIDHFRKMGAKYLVINSRKLLSEEYLQPYLAEKVIEHKGITVYKL